jgi:hypothetical protein
MACVFDEVPRLSYIARAWIAGEDVQRLGGDGTDTFAPILRIGVYEVAHQQGIIRGLLTQGGHDDGEHVQPMIHILSCLVHLRARLRPMHQEPARHLRHHGLQR